MACFTFIVEFLSYSLGVSLITTGVIGKSIKLVVIGVVCLLIYLVVSKFRDDNEID